MTVNMHSYRRLAPSLSQMPDLDFDPINDDGKFVSWDKTNSKFDMVAQGVDPVVDSRITALEDTYVRSTRFATITTTTGTVTKPANSTIILNDFGGALDCDIQGIADGRPNGEAAFDTNGSVIASTFDTDGAYVLSGTPAAASVALVYRVRQKFTDYVDTSADIIGDTFKEYPTWLRVNVTSAMSPYTPTEIKNTIFAVDLNGGSVIVNLPEVSELIEGEACKIYVERIGAGNTLTVNTFGAQTMRGATSQVMWELRDAITLYAHTFLSNHWDILEWPRTDEILYHAGNTGVTTVRTIQEKENYAWSAGRIGAAPAFTDNTNNTCNIGAFEAILRSSNTVGDPLRLYRLAALTNQSVPAEALYYLTASYNSGTPIARVTTPATAGVNNDSVVLIGFLYNTAGVIHFTEMGDVPVDLPQKYHSLEQFKNGYVSKVTGGVVSSPAGRYLQTTAGYYKQGATFASVSAINTSVTGNFVRIYGDTSAGFTRVATQTQFNNTDYWNGGTDTLTALSAGRYTVRWIYQVINAVNYFVEFIHNAQYTSLADARAATIPTERSVELQSPIGPSTVIARVIVRQGQANIIEVENYSISNRPTVTPTGNHNDLAGLQGGTVDEYYHLTQAQHAIATQAAGAAADGYITTGTQTIAGAKTFSSHPLSTDADTPAANELIPVAKVGAVIAAATEKTTPVDADLVGISDSADSGILKKLTWANLKAALRASFLTSWVSYTHTGGWTSNVSANAFYRRVGDSIEVRGSLVLTGAPNAAHCTLLLPSGLSVDTSKMPASGMNYKIGRAYILDDSTRWYSGSVLYNAGNIYGNVCIAYDTVMASTIEMSLVTATAPITFANADVLSFEYSLPISGW